MTDTVRRSFDALEDRLHRVESLAAAADLLIDAPEPERAATWQILHLLREEITAARDAQTAHWDAIKASRKP